MHLFTKDKIIIMYANFVYFKKLFKLRKLCFMYLFFSVPEWIYICGVVCCWTLCIII